MKFTVIIVLASVLASYVSFISALARPKLSASRIQMTTKMSNGMAAKIKTMDGLMTVGLMTVSTPAWAQDVVPITGVSTGGLFTGIKLPNEVKLTSTTTDPGFLFFECTSEFATALVFTPEAEARFKFPISKPLSSTCTTSRVEVYLPDPSKAKDSGVLSKNPVFVSQGGNLKIDRTVKGFWTIKY